MLILVIVIGFRNLAAGDADFTDLLSTRKAITRRFLFLFTLNLQSLAIRTEWNQSGKQEQRNPSLGFFLAS